MHSRAARLSNYVIKGIPVDVEIEVRWAGASAVTPLVGTLQVEAASEMLSADWMSGGPEDDDRGTNRVPWKDTGP